jgi:hypothetical protein
MSNNSAISNHVKHPCIFSFVYFVSLQSLHSAPEKAAKEVGYVRRIGSVSDNPDRCFSQGSRSLGFGALALRTNTIREPVVFLCERAFSQRIYSKAEAGKVFGKYISCRTNFKAFFKFTFPEPHTYACYYSLIVFRGFGSDYALGVVHSHVCLHAQYVQNISPYLSWMPVEPSGIHSLLKKTSPHAFRCFASPMCFCIYSMFETSPYISPWCMLSSVAFAVCWKCFLIHLLDACSALSLF